MASTSWKSSRIVKKNAHINRIFIKEETRAHVKKVSAILKKADVNRTEDEWQLLQQSEDVVEVILKRTQVKEQTKQRHLEIEDSPDLLQDKCEKLASVIRNAKSLAVYTGAGISTAASIPDYRGPNGVWTLLKQGKQLRSVDLCDAEPTLTHMAIVELYKRGYVKHVVSQNCDGLHLRSGLPRSALSELHGNMYIEVCRECHPPVEYVRLFDVTERTAMRRHKTGRRCLSCSSALFDTIVHFGEKGAIEAPYNWHRAVEAADSADVILCLGSSLKVLKKYACLWGMHKPVAKRPCLFIVNLQWTPKDHGAALKINGRCDHVMRMVMKHLEIDIPPYIRNADPIFVVASQLEANEDKSMTKKILSQLGSSIHCSQLHSEGKRGKERWIKKQQLPSQPCRVMLPRRVKSSAQRTVRTSKEPLTSCGPTPRVVENAYDRSGNCSFVVLHSANVDTPGLRECSNGARAEVISSEQSQRHFCGSLSPNNINHVQEFKLQSVVDRPLEMSSAVVASWNRLTGFQGVSWKGLECDQLLNEIDRTCNHDKTDGKGMFWWDKIDSRTWLDALQAYLLQLNSGRKNVADTHPSCTSATSQCHFSTSNLSGASAATAGFCLSGNDVADCNVSRQSTGEMHRDASKDLQKQLNSDETQHKRLAEESRECDCSEKLLTAPKLELPIKRSDDSAFGKLNNESERVPCGRMLCGGTQDDDEAMKLCTLSDLKVMHKVLFDSDTQRNRHSSTENVCQESGCLAMNALLQAESKPLNGATRDLNVTDVNVNAKNVMANADLVRFMHSYCQQEMGAKQEPHSSHKPTDISLLPSNDRIPRSFVDFIQGIICSKEDAEKIRAAQGIGQIRRNQVNGNSELVTGVRAFHLKDSDTLHCLYDCIVQQKQYSASFSPASKCDENCDNPSTVVGYNLCPDVGKSSCLTQLPEHRCDTSSRNLDSNSHAKEKKRNHDLISMPGWFGKGISLRKRKRKIFT